MFITTYLIPIDGQLGLCNFFYYYKHCKKYYCTCCHALVIAQINRYIYIYTQEYEYCVYMCIFSLISSVFILPTHLIISQVRMGTICYISASSILYNKMLNIWNIHMYFLNEIIEASIIYLRIIYSSKIFLKSRYIVYKTMLL